MTAMRKYQLIIVALLLVIAGGVYKFVIKGNVAQGEDKRVAIVLDAGERNFILGEMRALLAKMQQLIAAVSNNDMDRFTEIAKMLKEESQGETQQSLIGKMPIAFKLMSREIHASFDQLHADAVDKRDREHSLKQVAELMNHCVACHSAFSLKAATEEIGR